MTLLRILSLILITLSLFGCKKEMAEYAAPAGRLAMVSKEKVADSVQPPMEEKSSVIGKKVIKDGDISFQCEDIKATRGRIDAQVAKVGGYVINENEQTHTDKVEQRLTIRVPADAFDAFISAISEGVTRFDWKNIQATDVTEEYLDVETRLTVKKETENKFREILGKARSVEEILAVEKHLGEIRAEIESMEGRLKYLDNRVNFSTLNLTIYQSVSAPVGFWLKLKAGIGNGWNNFIWFILGLVNFWPFVILGFVILIVILGSRKNRKGMML